MSKPHVSQNYGGVQRNKKVIPETMNGTYWDKWGQSFATVVKEKEKADDSKIPKTGPREEVMNGDDKHSDSRWLEFGAVGVLKGFNDISSVVKSMLNRGIKFNFYYLGDKNIVSVRIFFKRLGWDVGETLLIDEATINRSNLAIGRALVLIPFNHSCPKVIKVVTGRRSFSIQVLEEPTPVSYSDILELLGLDWDDDDVDSKKEDCMKKKVNEGIEVMWTNRRMPNQLIGNKSRANHCKDKVGNGEVETLVDKCLGKETNTDGINMSIKGKGKVTERGSGNQRQIVDRPAVPRGALVLGEKMDNRWNASFNESE
ncbi:hypothetical protein Q3G72_021372 [Acer saccharum]|nr:hypothetical protein Q3G72_021372 [Acer saccharum]